MADPKRRCIVSGESGDTFGLIRFVLSPDGEVVPDLAERLPGRGAWLTADRAVLEKALRRNPFSRAFRQETRLRPDLIALLEQLLRRRGLDLLGLAARAGQVVAGFDKVAEAARAGRIGVMVLAADAGPSAREKAVRMAAGRPLIDVFDRDELGLALGRVNVVHAAVSPGRLAGDLRREVARLLGVAGGARNLMDGITDDR